MPTANRLSIAEERQEAEYAAAAQKSQRTGRRMALDTRGRPVLPPYPLLTGVVEFPVHEWRTDTVDRSDAMSGTVGRTDDRWLAGVDCLERSQGWR